MTTQPASGEPPVVSVVIAAHNAARVLPEQLAALSVQTHQFPWEVIVADNGSGHGKNFLSFRGSPRASQSFS